MRLEFVPVAATRQAVRQDLAVLDLVPGDSVLVACSGGSDSLALAAALAYESQRVGKSTRQSGFAIRAGAVVVDHGLQDGSAEVAATAAEQCRSLGLDPVLVVRATVPPSPSGPEAAARDARYTALKQALADTGAKALLLGHTLDDQAEQVLLGLARGSGARSLAGIPPTRGPFRRPLLHLTRAQLQAACEQLNLSWWEDPTNSDPAANLRAKVRHEALPALEQALGPGISASLARTASQLREDTEVLDDIAADLVALAQTGTNRYNVDTLAEVPSPLRKRALKQAVTRVTEAALTAQHLAALDRLITDYSGQSATYLPSGAKAWRECGNLYLEPAEILGTEPTVNQTQGAPSGL